MKMFDTELVLMPRRMMKSVHDPDTGRKTILGKESRGR